MSVVGESIGDAVSPKLMEGFHWRQVAEAAATTAVRELLDRLVDDTENIITDSYGMKGLDVDYLKQMHKEAHER